MRRSFDFAYAPLRMTARVEKGGTYAPPFHNVQLNFRFSSLAGEEDDLLLLCQILQQVYRCFHPVVVETHQHVVQDQGGFGGQFLRHCQTQGQIQLIHCTIAAPQGLPEGIFLLCPGVKRQLLIQRQVVDNIAGLIIDGQLHEGETARIDVSSDGATLEATPVVAPQATVADADEPLEPEVEW